MVLVARGLASGLKGSIGTRISDGKVFKTKNFTILELDHFRHPGSQTDRSAQDRVDLPSFLCSQLRSTFGISHNYVDLRNSEKSILKTFPSEILVPIDPLSSLASPLATRTILRPPPLITTSKPSKNPLTLEEELPNREANKLRVISRSQFCSGVHQSRRISK